MPAYSRCLLDKIEKQKPMAFNNEEKFENALIEMLSKKGWEKEVLRHPTEKDLLKNWANILFDNNNTIDRLNGQRLTEGEMQQLMDQISTLRTPQMLNGFINGRTVSVKRDNPADTLHLGKEITLKIFDPHEIAAGQSRYQIVKQPHFSSSSPLLQQRRGDLMLLINGMPVIHIELKKSGIPVSQAYNQIEKYSREGIFSGLFQLIQIFVAMNPEETVYFANPGPDGRFNKDFYFHWADFNNVPQNDWKDIATYLLSIPMAHQLIGYYTIADRTDGVLKVLRSYQYFAVRAIYDRVAKHRDWHDTDHQLGGYIWHTTGSGKTMSSFKAAQLIADSGNADKVIFVIDRIELGTQSAREYRNFSQEDEAIQETEDTQALIAKMKSPNVSDTLIVSSIQKLGIIAEDGIRQTDLKKIREKRIVFIVDECHRSTFGDSFRDIKATFPTAMFFGFTGTPIQDENRRQQSTTTDIFGDELHRYSIADGIRDGNVLGFDPYKVMTYKDKDLKTQVALNCAGANSVKEVMQDEEKTRIFNRIMGLPMAGHYGEEGMWISGIEDMVPATQYLTEEHMNAVVDDILEGWLVLSKNHKFHAIFTVPSIPQAIKYYRIFKERATNLKVTALFDPSLPNDNPDKTIFKENALAEIISDYKEMFGQSYTIAEHAKFKKDLSNRLAHKKPYIGLEQPANRDKRLDLLIVVSQMLTGFDSKWVNTLYIDKVIEYEELIQAFSRTNRLYSRDEKPFGVIKYYSHPHTMEYLIKEAVRLYSGDKPLGLFVSKLDVNLGGMNQKYREIALLFEQAGIENFARLPEATALRGRFAVLFREYNQYLDAAKVQGFNWGKLTYLCPNGEEVTVNHDERTYNTLVQRYKELFGSGGGGGGGNPQDEEPPYDLDPHLSEIDTGKIDADYMNHNFERYRKALEQPNVTEEELQQLLNDLSASFASLPQEEQRYAEIFLHDVQSANITLEPGKTFRDYITEYMTTEQDHRVSQLVNILGVDREQLKTMLNLQITEQNLNEFNRFSRLKESVDAVKAKAYFEAKTGQKMSVFKVNIEVNNLLKRFLLEGGFDIEVNKGEEESSAQEVKLGILTDIRKDASVKLLVDNMMTLDVGTSILQIVAACQQEFGIKYPAMIKQPKAWLHLIDNYVKEKTTRYDLQPEETFYWMAAESSEEEKDEKQMKTLSVQQPWASLICSGVKDIENRTWQPKTAPGRILIHASGKIIPKDYDLKYLMPEEISTISNLRKFGIIPEFEDMPLSAIIGYVDVVGFTTNSGSFWAGEGQTHWQLKNAWLFDEPITGVKGKLGLFDYPLAPDNLPSAHQVATHFPKIVNDELVVHIGKKGWQWLNSTADVFTIDLNDPYTVDNVCNEGSFELKPVKSIRFIYGVEEMAFYVDEFGWDAYRDAQGEDLIYGEDKTLWAYAIYQLGKRIK